MSNVCFPCRFRSPDQTYAYGLEKKCPNCGQDLEYIHVHVPLSRDDHKMWALAEEKAYTPSRRPRRRKREWNAVKRSFRSRNNPLADWERELLKAAMK